MEQTNVRTIEAMEDVETDLRMALMRLWGVESMQSAWC